MSAHDSGVGPGTGGAAGQGAQMGVGGEAPAVEEKMKQAAMQATSADLCPSCGDSAFVRVEGCHTCYACGYSEC